MTVLGRFTSCALLIASITACASAPQPSHVVLLNGDNPTLAINTALRATDPSSGSAPINEARYTLIAITARRTYLVPSRDDDTVSPSSILCSEPSNSGDWTNMRNFGGLATLDANMKVRIIPPGASLESVPFVDALTDDGYIGQICASDLKLE